MRCESKNRISRDHEENTQEEIYKNLRSSLIYNTSARHEWHKCDMSNTNVTRVQHSEIQPTRLRHRCDTSTTWTTRVRHECYTNDTSATRVKNFYFDNYTSKNMFSHPCIYYMASERLQGEEQLHSKNYLLEMPRSHAKMRLKSAPQKLFNGKRYMKKLYSWL